jgi:hypothetical protein
MIVVAHMPFLSHARVAHAYCADSTLSIQVSLRFC